MQLNRKDAAGQKKMYIQKVVEYLLVKSQPSLVTVLFAFPIFYFKKKVKVKSLCIVVVVERRRENESAIISVGRVGNNTLNDVRQQATNSNNMVEHKEQTPITR